MAIWQFHIYFIPQKTLLNRYKQVPTQLVMDKDAWSDYIQKADLSTKPDFEDALTIPWWLDLDINFDSIMPILKTFGDIQSWTLHANDIRSFGDVDSNDISVGFNDSSKIIEEISCRLDLRQFDKGFIDKVLSFAKQFDCLLMDRQGRLYKPSLFALLETIKQSNAKRFVYNGEKFLTDLSKGNVTPE